MGVLVLVLDDHLRRPDAQLADLPGGQPAAGQAEGVDRLVDFFQRHADVDQGGQHHVSADAAETIEIRDSHRKPFISREVDDGEGLYILPAHGCNAAWP